MSNVHTLLNLSPGLKRAVFGARKWYDLKSGRGERRRQARIALTTSCCDCEDIPKVPDAGEIVEEAGLPVQVMHNGIKVLAGGYNAEWMARIIHALKGHCKPQEEKVFHEVLKHVRDDATMVELGASWAYHSLWFRKDHPNRRNFLVEPIAEKAEEGRQNFALNGCEADLTVGYVGAPRFATGPFLDWDGHTVDVPCIVLDEFVRAKGIDFIDVLHADIQGAELEMLEGARELFLWNRIGYVFLSTHFDRHQPCRRFLLDAGYTLIAEHTVEEGYAADGLIVAQGPAVRQVPRVDISCRIAGDAARAAFGGLAADIEGSMPETGDANDAPVSASASEKNKAAVSS